MWNICLHILGLAGTTLSCMKCDKPTMEIFGDLRYEYVDRNIRTEDDKDIEPALVIRKKVRAALDVVMEENFGMSFFSPVIDDAGLYKLASALRTLMKSVMSADHKGEDLLTEVVWLVQEMEKTVKQHLITFLRDSYCFNKCGLLLQEVLECQKCKKRVHNCSANGVFDLNCGERFVTVQEGDDVTLDCSMTWHVRLAPRKLYILYKKINSKKEKQAVSDESVMAKKQVLLSDAGSYECHCVNERQSIIFSIIHFRITVVKEEITTGVVKTRPTLEPLYSTGAVMPQDIEPEKSLGDNTLYIIIAVSSGILLGIIIACICICYKIEGIDPVLERLEKREQEREILLMTYGYE